MNDKLLIRKSPELDRLQSSIASFCVQRTNANLDEIKNSINKFMGDNKCSQIIYTDNRDNLFFGMCVYPNISDNDIYSTLTSHSKIKKNIMYSYVIELDSKLFSEELGLNANEILAILLHEIGHIIYNDKCLEEINYMSNMILADNDDIDLRRDFRKYVEYFRYAIYLTMRKTKSIFEKNQEEYIADGIVIEYGYGENLSSAFKKILKQRKSFIVDSNNRAIALLWAYKVTKQLHLRNVNIQYHINEIERVTGSKTERNLIQKLRKIARQYGFIAESEITVGDDVLNELNILSTMQRKGLYSLEDDLYEYTIRIKNLESEIEALDLIRTINYKINIIKEFITSNPDDYDMERWQELLNKYLYLREQLMKTQIYRDKYYGLFVEIPKVKGRYQL